MKEIILPFTCEQFNKALLIIFKVIKWMLLLGTPILGLYGIYLNQWPIVFMGFFFTAFLWFIQIMYWTETGFIKCKCKKDEKK